MADGIAGTLQSLRFIVEGGHIAKHPIARVCEIKTFLAEVERQLADVTNGSLSISSHPQRWRVGMRCVI